MFTANLAQNGTPKKLSKRQKIDKLVSLIFSGKTNMTKNADIIGIGRRTAYRYWNQWVESEEAQQVDIEWWAQFNQLKKKSPIRAFEGLTRIKIRKTPHKMEMREEIKIEEKRVAILAEYTGAINSATERDIQALRTRKQMDTTPTNTETS